jgi:hypothetical protein
MFKDKNKLKKSVKLALLLVPMILSVIGIWNGLSVLFHNKKTEKLGNKKNENDDKDKTSGSISMQISEKNPNTHLFISCGGFME